MITKSLLEPLDYDDILLLPTNSDINSRNDVNLFNKDGYIPIFSAPMLNISEPKVIIELSKLGGVGILHRFFKDSIKERYEKLNQIIDVLPSNYGISIGVHDFNEELKFVEYAVNHGCKFVVIDTASGYLEKTIKAVETLKLFRETNYFTFKIIAGNVVDYIGAYNLAKAGADIIRINIGTGVQCTTSKAIGIGCPPLTAIKDCSGIKNTYPNIMLLADGGIYNSGRALKALAFGADGIMVGSLFGRALEAENKGKIFGMSSYELQDRMNKEKKSNEGIVTIIPESELKPLREIFTELTFGLKSGMSYLGINDINKIHDEEIEYIGVNNNVR